ncbi:MAG: DUF1987 domain-containing protein [Spirochaetia bacterium]|nr:DUF1987 domain-containing protein [Spirochaetia bacterium]
MNEYYNDTVNMKDLSLVIKESAEDIEIRWTGRSTERDPSLFLTPLFSDILNRQKKIKMDFKSLEYMNSSTITPILKVLDRLKNSNGAIVIIYDKNQKWQELSFTALEIFRTTDLRIDIRGA